MISYVFFDNIFIYLGLFWNLAIFRRLVDMLECVQVADTQKLNRANSIDLRMPDINLARATGAFMLGGQLPPPGPKSTLSE